MRELLSAFCLFLLAEKPVMLSDQYDCEMTGTQLIAPVNLVES
jgi:hypothetical protein